MNTINTGGGLFPPSSCTYSKRKDLADGVAVDETLVVLAVILAVRAKTVLNTSLVSNTVLVLRSPSLRYTRIADDSVHKSSFGPCIEARLVSVRIEPLVVTSIRVEALVVLAIVISGIETLVLVVATAVGDARRGVRGLEGAGDNVAVITPWKPVPIFLLVEDCK
jgi:hypothetical protein